MVRPLKNRCLKEKPTCYYFKPRGIKLKNLTEINLSRDEFEALKLHEVDNLSHIEAASKMLISQPTFSRILDKAHKKIAYAIVYGQAIKIENLLAPNKNRE